MKKHSLFRINGFTIVEALIALAVLCCFLLPIISNLMSLRRISFGARDSVIVNSHIFSALADLQAIPFSDLGDSSSATFTSTLCKYDGSKQIGLLTIETKIKITPGNDSRIKVIEIEVLFGIPGANPAAPKRRMTGKGFSFASSM
ncbi:MAG: hypothetical protein HQM08_20285 [Candidatus Riflebacteria bacterium]|nr:hypothetical protein [Candidatus Riflebacteria bacterium]